MPRESGLFLLAVCCVFGLGAAPPAANEVSQLHLSERSLDPDAAATRAAGRVVHAINRIKASLRRTRYQSRTVVRPKKGVYGWDCSGMASWILRRSAPRAFAALRRRRALARDFYHAIRRAPVAASRRGWQRLRHISQARPGDVFAWLRSPLSRSKVTGHVGFFVSRPRQLPDKPWLYLARIVDATSLPHQRDTRRSDGEGGFGFGTVLFVVDRRGGGRAYGWYGTKSLEWGVLPAKILFGRVVR